MSKSLLPKVIFGTSSLGNLYADVPFSTKKEIVSEIIENTQGPAVFDSAGKYGAGLSLSSLGQALTELGVAQDKAIISNKLGWKQTPLAGPEPTFEPGVWINLKNDAVQDISYEGILECYEQGNNLLGDYNARIVSVHDPDEFLDAAANDQDLQKRRSQLIDAYRALAELKSSGKVDAIGVGAKNIDVIEYLNRHVELDWAMFACSLTPYSHKPNALQLLKDLGKNNVSVINSAVFNAGFLIGGDYFDYRKVTPESDPELFAWREQFFGLCAKYDVDPAAACAQFSFRFPQVCSVALNTSSPRRVKGNILLADCAIPEAFWQDMHDQRLISIKV